MSYKLTPEEITRVQHNAKARWDTQNPLAIWSMVLNNDNVVSRQVIKDLCPNAPAAKAPMKAWRAWIVVQFPDFEAMKAEESRRHESEAEARRKEYRLSSLKYHAENCAGYVSGNFSGKNALDFAQQLMSAGWTARVVRGCATFENADTGIRIGPMRDARINSAIEYLNETTAQS